MAIKKIYTSGDQELQIQWSPEGIHLTITTNDVMVPTEFIIEPWDIDEVIEDLRIYEDAIYQEKIKYNE